MQILLELLSNPIALFILIGVISSLFNQKKKDGSQQPQRRPVRPPGPVQPPRPAPARRQPAEARTEPLRPEIEKNNDYNPRSENRRPAEPSRDKRGQSPVDSGVEVLTDIQKKYQERKRQTEESAKKQQTGRMSSSQTSGRLNQKREQVQTEVVFQPDKDTLVEGLIWAEVLGKPRAKKHYNPSRRY
ncbi:hypothetical protein J7E38_00465 [Bacillus sp. ISL-35]|uniref:hypothetical protein n=1 Tax=Bacillus sp. ISL-35 TaxID=2819122 RepID=UPI001BE78BD8|nr:hypothetical protein [Bacillus sp. ISL-35]MBT2677448.1 hypothetical protein [Bacillus sp. ISL-35]MBT2702164.1 hypothetical protein [Chryseobacterium sp. ISL-80]